MREMDVAVSRLHFPVTTLGPGRRVGLWFQGCSIRCPGCVSVDTWTSGIGLVPIEELLDRISALSARADGLTLSGGEPLDQPDALAAVLSRWRAASNGSTLVFTGYDFVRASAWLSAHPSLVDAMITGPFRSDLPQTHALRGSDNQQLHVLSELGAEFLAYERPAGAEDRRLDVIFDERGDAWLAGIPARGDLRRLRRALAAAGHRSLTSDATGSSAR
jgi:anaerobic ribonucleoside-triphosphate reductase activating protein